MQVRTHTTPSSSSYFSVEFSCCGQLKKAKVQVKHMHYLGSLFSLPHLSGLCFVWIYSMCVFILSWSEKAFCSFLTETKAVFTFALTHAFSVSACWMNPPRSSSCFLLFVCAWRWPASYGLCTPSRLSAVQ